MKQLTPYTVIVRFMRTTHWLLPRGTAQWVARLKRAMTEFGAVVLLDCQAA